ncbi:7 transmembrane sweet-taste receptor of 3 GCPR-domain-containing protein [Paraphysoderma sedebokerense]|nr:7 transmembrane sweet-taste receptor of 3 GCPR-domain-containing protein [Paraphysoderma sedebokerense]
MPIINCNLKGGSGVFMTKQSKHKNLAWKLMKILINNDFGVTKVLNQEQGTVPPYESAQDNSPWNSAQYEISRLGLKRAVPLQYPATTFPQFGEIESRKPFRLLLAEMIYKNVSAEVAVERACQIIDHVFLPKCSMKHIKSSLSECYQNGSMLKWALMLYVIFTSVAFIVFRTRASIKRSGFLFSQCTIFGARLCTIAVMLGVGKPTESTCVGFTAFLSIGFVVMFGSFIAKLYRIQQIFHGSKKVAKNKKLTDAVLFRYLCGIVLVEALLLVLWAIVDVPGLTVHRSFVQNVGTVTQATCKHGSTMAAALLLYNAVLILAAAIIAFKVRNVPTDFNETKVMVFAVYSVTFIIAIVVPTTTQLTHSQSFQTLILFGCLLATSSSIIVFTAPKLLAAFRDEKGSAITQFPGYSGEKSTISKCVCKLKLGLIPADFFPLFHRYELALTVQNIMRLVL